MAEFVALSTEQLPQLMEKLHKFLPDTLPIYYTADNTVQGRLSVEDVHFYVNAWPEPTCVALVSPAQSGQLHNYRTTVDLWGEDPAMVISFLRDSTFLDWNQPIFFRVQYLDDQEIKQIQSLMAEKQGSVSCVERHVYVLASSPPDVKPLPQGYKLMESLSQSDAEIAGYQYSAWGVKPVDTIRYFQGCAAHLQGSSIHTESGELVAYAALHHTSALGSVVTDPRHQRKGLGAAAVTDVCWKIKNDKQTPYVYVNPENSASVGLYKKCGFEFQTKAFRIRFVPKRDH